MFENFTAVDFLITGVFLIIVLLAVIIYAIDKVRFLAKELRIINIEISDTDGREQRHWKKKKRRLWLSLIPFVKY